MLGLGKKRTRFGKWLDKQEDINQLELEKATKLSRPTISRLCNDKNYIPKYSTIHRINAGLRKLKKDVKVEDFLQI
ncbi:helix-turn-helix domain-containing protein [Priestia megaterium]|uniref:helix-turn-helix domain-containing protein n=1 Tax=Priestia megaterium TaxID=1404 RepID=UPI00101CD609|nr:helix-turn-helix domain-containing protein [Priestia megaterium]